MKGSRVETIEAARKEYAELLKEGWNHENSFLLFYKNPIKGASIFTNSDDEINGHKLWLDWDSIEVFVQKPFQITKN